MIIDQERIKQDLNRLRDKVEKAADALQLPMLEEETAEGGHGIVVENVEDELYVHLEHPMEREHYISFLAYVTDSHLQMEKLYPEQGAETRFRRKGPGKLLAFCNRHGLFKQRIP